MTSVRAMLCCGRHRAYRNSRLETTRQGRETRERDGKRRTMRSLRDVGYIVALLAAAYASSVPALAQTAPAGIGALQYRSIGPAISGGRTTAVVGSDRDPLLYYAGGADGGIFKSVDGGASWLPVFDRQSSAAIGVIAIAPNDTHEVWAG